MQVYFLFLESLGTPEIVLVLFVALMVFGPRKLPTIGRTIGKYTADFKRASRDFRDVWEREVQMSDFEQQETDGAKENLKNNSTKNNSTDEFNAVENTIGRTSMRQTENEIEISADLNASPALPEVRQVNHKDFAAASAAAETELQTAETVPNSKRDWL